MVVNNLDVDVSEAVWRNLRSARNRKKHHYDASSVRMAATKRSQSVVGSRSRKIQITA